MQNNLTIKGATAQSIYSQANSGYYIINRRYQRKLVWGIEEKASFIESLLNGYPVPMIIAANYKKPDGMSCLEILDGMQRLNSIISFIEGEFEVSGGFFDLESINQTNSLKQKGFLEQKLPVLSAGQCSVFLDYPVPFSIFDESDPYKLDETFRRINTGGRKLSEQDVRQAGAIGVIADIVNATAMYVRKDSSHSNLVDLRNMKDISLSNRGLNYGINLQDVFWAKHGIIQHNNLRDSRDEELVAYLISYMADPNNSHPTKTYLDDIYVNGSAASNSLTSQINKITPKILVRQFVEVFEEVRKVVESSGVRFTEQVFSGRPTNIKQVYQIIFIAMYKLLIIKNLSVTNYENINKTLRGIFDNHLSILREHNQWNQNKRNSLSESVVGLIGRHFKPKAGNNSQLGGWVASLENIINESKTEQVCYDFKMGFSQITGGVVDYLPKVTSKIVKTLTAMTNSKPGDCYVIVGVADKESDSIAHESHYNSKNIKYKNFFITGIDEEAKKYHGSIEKLEQKIIQQLMSEPISNDFKTKIKDNLITFSYGEKQLCVFKVSRGSKPELYNNVFYKRTLSHIEEIQRADEFEFFKLFEANSELAEKLNFV